MKTALIINDDETLRGYYKTVLDDMGLNVLISEDGAIGIKTLEENSDIDLVILDLKEERNGRSQAYARLKDIKRIAKLLLISDAHDYSADETIMNLGAEKILIKPFTLPVLSSTINELIGQ